MKTIGKLLIKGICVIAPIFFLCIYAWKNPLAFMDEEAPYYLWNKEKTNIRQEKNYKTIILGDSAANAAYIPEILSDTTINLALGGTTPVENYYIMQEWLKNNPAPDVCYISFLDSHFQMEDCFWTRTMYAHRFSLKQNMEIVKAAVYYKENSIINKNWIADFIAYECYFPNKYITSLLNASFNQRKENNIREQQMNELHRGRYIARGTAEYQAKDIITYDRFWVNSLFDDYYRKIIDLCMENGIQVRLIKLPLPDNEIFTEEYKLELENYYGELEESYPGLTVDWFSSYDKSCFNDICHMNSHGALQFSMELKELYADDFKDSDLSFTQERIAGWNDSIKAENKIEWILKWITGKDYTIIFNDTTGMFLPIKEKELKKNSFIIYPFQSDQLKNNPCIYFISGTNNNSNFTVYDLENGLLLQLENEKEQIWEIMDGALNIIVIDNYNNNVVCMKYFQYETESFIQIYK